MLSSRCPPELLAIDVVVTDLGMSEVHGLAVLQGARSRPAVPDVIVTAAFGTADIER